MSRPSKSSSAERFPGEHSLEHLRPGDTFLMRVRRRTGRVDTLYGRAQVGQTLVSLRRTGPFEPTKMFFARHHDRYAVGSDRIASFKIVDGFAPPRKNPPRRPAERSWLEQLFG